VRCPEGNLLTVEQFGQTKGIAAVGLGWFQYYLDSSSAFVRRRVPSLGLYTHLNLVRLKGDHRPAADLLWSHGEEFARAQPTP
jgi:hypothetical protein